MRTRRTRGEASSHPASWGTAGLSLDAGLETTLVPAPLGAGGLRSLVRLGSIRLRFSRPIDPGARESPDGWSGIRQAW